MTWGSERKNSRVVAAALQPYPAAVVSLLHQREEPMLGTILIIVLILILLGSLPTWGYSRGWGYGPSGLLGTVLVIVLILWLLGKI
jgi:hypothetical protein